LSNISKSCTDTLAANDEILMAFYPSIFSKKWLVKLVVNKYSYAWQAGVT